MTLVEIELNFLRTLFLVVSNSIMGKQSEFIQGSGKIVLVVAQSLIRANTFHSII